MKNIWVIQTAFIGDCVLSLPFLYRLLEFYPDAQVDLVTTSVGAELFELAKKRGLAPFSDRLDVHVYKKREAGIRGFFSLLRKLRYSKKYAPDRVFCLQRSFRSALLGFLSGSKVRVGFSSGAASFLYSHGVARNWDNGQPEIEKNLDLLRCSLGDENKNIIPRWNPETAVSLLKTNLHPSPKVRLVALSLGSPWPTKRWPVENALEMTHELLGKGIALCLIGDKSAAPLAEELIKALPSLLIQNRVGQTSVEEWVDLIAQSSLLVSGDSAAVHIASDLNVPVVALFGPTLPDFGFAPWRKNSQVLGIQNLVCRPCHIHGPKVCPQSHHRCLKDIKGKAVEKVVDEILSRNNF